jgi:hypothetical protein
MSKAGKKLIASVQEVENYLKFQAKADELLALGDRAASEGRSAESRRLLRQCRRYRLKARAIAIEHYPPKSLPTPSKQEKM